MNVSYDILFIIYSYCDIVTKRNLLLMTKWLSSSPEAASMNRMIKTEIRKPLSLIRSVHDNQISFTFNNYELKLINEIIGTIYWTKREDYLLNLFETYENYFVFNLSDFYMGYIYSYTNNNNLLINCFLIEDSMIPELKWLYLYSKLRSFRNMKSSPSSPTIL